MTEAPASQMPRRTSMWQAAAQSSRASPTRRSTSRAEAASRARRAAATRAEASGSRRAAAIRVAWSRRAGRARKPAIASHSARRSSSSPRLRPARLLELGAGPR
ncbi:MAG: hypothetical protein R3F30_09710 [Planctomycetota bacterium]